MFAAIGVRADGEKDMPAASHGHREANGSLRMKTTYETSTHGNDGVQRSVAEIKQKAAKEKKYTGENGENSEADQAAP